MIASEISNFISVRNGNLSSDEILSVIDVTKNQCINHIIYENGKWEMWAETGEYFTFSLRTWH